MTALAATNSRITATPVHERAAVTLVKDLGLIPYPSSALSGPNWSTLHAGKSHDLNNGWSLRVTAEDAGRGIIAFRVGVIIAVDDRTWNMGRGNMDIRNPIPILSWQTVNHNGAHVPPLLDARQIEEIERAFDKRHQQSLHESRAKDALKALSNAIATQPGARWPSLTCKAAMGDHGPEVRFEFAVADPARVKEILEFLNGLDTTPAASAAPRPRPRPR